MAVVLALVGALAALFGPGLVRVARGISTPILHTRAEQREFEAWVGQQSWHEPTTPELSEARLAEFLALRKDLRGLEERAASLRPQGPDPGPRRRGRLEDVPGIVGRVNDVITDRFAAFRKHGITPPEYTYIERLVYGTWLPALAASGDDPASRDRAAREVEDAAEKEGAGAVRARLRQVASSLRSKVPDTPEGVPPEVHRLLLAHAGEIEAQPRTRVAAGVPRLRERRSSEASAPP